MPSIKDIEKLANDIKEEQKKLDLRQSELNIMIADLTKQETESNHKKDTGWLDKLEDDEKYFFIDDDNTAVEDSNCDSSIDESRVNALNVFSAEPKAEEIAFKQLLFRKLQKFADENNDKINWQEGGNKKYFITCRPDEQYWIRVENTCFAKGFGQVYFSSEKIAQKALDTYKEEIEKYFKI